MHRPVIVQDAWSLIFAEIEFENILLIGIMCRVVVHTDVGTKLTKITNFYSLECLKVKTCSPIICSGVVSVQLFEACQIV